MRITTVADLRAALADLPDWAAVRVATYEHDPEIDALVCDGDASISDLSYGAGVLVIDTD